MRYITAIAAFAAAVSGAAVPAPQAGGTCDVASMSFSTFWRKSILLLQNSGSLTNLDQTACGAALANAGIACGRTAKTRWDVADCAVSAGVTVRLDLAHFCSALGHCH